MLLPVSKLPLWPIGETLQVDSHSGRGSYTITRVGEVDYRCDCMAWRVQRGKKAGDPRTCKHLRQMLGDEYETARTGDLPQEPAKKKAAGKRKAAAEANEMKGQGGSPSGGPQGQVPNGPKGNKAPSRKSASTKQAIDIQAIGPDDNLPDGGIQLLMAHKYELGKHNPTGYWVSEKLDGVRAYWDGHGTLWTRMQRPFAAPKAFLDHLPRGYALDGELFIDRGRFDETSGIVRTTTPGVENDARWQSIKYMVFDMPSLNTLRFEDRMAKLQQLFPGDQTGPIRVIEQVQCRGVDHLNELVVEVGQKGGEGLMLREPDSIYVGKRDKSLLKVKSFYDAEAVVVGYEPGRGKYEGMVGSLICQMASGQQFSVGSGLSDERRANPPDIGAIITYRFQELTKSEVPRFPTFVGQRVDVDVPTDAAVPRPARQAKEEVQAALPANS